MIEKDEFLSIFEELGYVHNDDIAVEVSYQMSTRYRECIVAFIYDIRKCHGLKTITWFEYPCDCMRLGRSPIDLVNRIYAELDRYFHMDMREKARRNYPKLVNNVKQTVLGDMEMKTVNEFKFTLKKDDADKLKRFANEYFGLRTTSTFMDDNPYWGIQPCAAWRRLANRIDRVIFNDPATIILWKSGEKTVVKCGPNETFDKEKGLAMALCKYILGNKGNFNEFFKAFMKSDGKCS